MNTVMNSSGGELRFEQQIPRVRHGRLPGETLPEFTRRMAQSIAFAFLLKVEQPAAEGGFDATGDTVVLPDGVVSRSTVRGKASFVRDAARIAATGADQLFISILQAGTTDIQPTRTGRRLRKGDIFVVDLAHPVTLFQFERTVMTMVIARGMLPESIRNLDFHCCEIRGGHPLARVIASMVERLIDDSPGMTMVQGSAVLRAAVDILALALADVQRPRFASVTLKASAEALIDDNIGNVALSPAWIADRLDVSRATLYRAFAPYGGVTSFIADRRRDSAWALVSSPDGPPFNEIAVNCGYAGKARLARAFADHFGATLETIRSANGEARARLREHASLGIIDGWDRRSGIATLNSGTSAVAANDPPPGTRIGGSQNH